jgi:putative restriction endonuclease
MSTALSSVTITRLEKVAVDNGLDQELPRQGDWLGFASTQVPLRLWLTALGDGLFLAAVSQQNVARALSDHGTAFTSPLPPGAWGARGVVDIPALHRLVRRAFQLSKTLPDEILHAFEKKTSALPKATEAERLVVQRVGQDLFRAGLLDYWEGRCAITGLAVPELLRASHIKPWADCDTDAERLDVFNGLLLAPHLDAAFDLGFIGVEEDGAVVVSGQLPAEARQTLGLAAPLRVKALAEGHRVYLPWHRSKVFKR